MINLMNLFSPAPASQGETTCAACAGSSPVGAVPDEFLGKLKQLIGQNVAAANSASVIDLGALLDQSAKQGEQATAELVAMLQSAGLMPPEIDPRDLGPYAGPGPVEELAATLEQLIAGLSESMRDSMLPVTAQQAQGLPLSPDSPKQDSNAAGHIQKQAGEQDQASFVFRTAQNVSVAMPQLKAFVETALQKCKEILDLQKTFLPMKGWIPAAAIPASQNAEGSMLAATAVSWSVTTQVMQVQQRAVSESGSLPVSAALPNQDLPSFIAVIRVRIQKITMVWKELTGSLKASFEAAAQPQAQQIEQLQTQSLWTLVRLVRTERAQSEKAPLVDQTTLNPMTSQNSALAEPLRALGQGEGNGSPVTEVLAGADEIAAPVQTGSDEFLDKPAIAMPLAASLLKKESGSRPEAGPLRLPAHVERLVMTQTLDRIRIVPRNGTQEIQIRLDPPELGRMQMKLAVEGSSVAARVTVENEAVKQVLEHGLPQLRETLSSQGLRVERFDVHVGFGFDQQPGRELRERWNFRRAWTQRSGNEVESLHSAPVLQRDDTGKRYGYNTIELLV